MTPCNLHIRPPKLATELGVGTLKELGYASKAAFQEQKLEVLRTHS